jgi:hypothetical protein
MEATSKSDNDNSLYLTFLYFIIFLKIQGDAKATLCTPLVEFILKGI